jgi:hypothetical protein
VGIQKLVEIGKNRNRGTLPKLDPACHILMSRAKDGFKKTSEKMMAEQLSSLGHR